MDKYFINTKYLKLPILNRYKYLWISKPHSAKVPEARSLNWNFISKFSYKLYFGILYAKSTKIKCYRPSDLILVYLQKPMFPGRQLGRNPPGQQLPLRTWQPHRGHQACLVQQVPRPSTLRQARYLFKGRPLGWILGRPLITET